MGAPNECTCKARWILNHSHLSYKTFHRRRSPFFVRPEHYVEILKENWEKVIDRIPAESQESHIGQEHLVVWKKL